MTDKAEKDSRSLKTWLAYGRQLLAGKGIPGADADAWILLAFSANIDRSYYALHMNDPMDEADAQLYYELLRRRTDRVPVQYLTGEAWFCGNLFRVTPDVLIPRMDTEVLVEEAGRRLEPGQLVLDLCTGSGCILLSLLKTHSVTGIGADISPAALALARENQRRLGCRATWIESDLFSSIGGTFDMIVSNPPYIASGEIAGLDPEVRCHEPITALDGGEDGLRYEKKIAREALSHLRAGGWLLLEIGCNQGDAMREALTGYGYEEVEIIRDLSGLDRVAAGRKKHV